MKNDFLYKFFCVFNLIQGVLMMIVAFLFDDGSLYIIGMSFVIIGLMLFGFWQNYKNTKYVVNKLEELRK